MPRINAGGLAILKKYEGCILYAYDDSVYPTVPFMPGDVLVGTLTIGWGHTAGVQPGETCTQEQADAWLDSDLEIFEQGVNDSVDRNLTPNQFSALVDFAYNEGIIALQSSTLLKDVNAGDFKGAANMFQYWVWADGQVDQGLIDRRAAEKELFLTP